MKDTPKGTKKQETWLKAPSISSGTLEALKWIGMISMTIDHFNRFFLNAESYMAFAIGRVAMPLFAFVFAYNLTQPDFFSEFLYFKYMRRLIFFGILATPAYIAMRHLVLFWPLNILFTLALACLLLYLKEKDEPVLFMFAVIVFLIGGIFVEYNWAGLLLCIGFWWYCRSPKWLALLTLCGAYFLLNELNNNYWALMSVPLILMASKVQIILPRLPYFFYCYYPFHLTLFWFLTWFY